MHEIVFNFQMLLLLISLGQRFEPLGDPLMIYVAKSNSKKQKKAEKKLKPQCLSVAVSILVFFMSVEATHEYIGDKDHHSNEIKLTCEISNLLTLHSTPPRALFELNQPDIGSLIDGIALASYS